ncbi:MAG: glycosyltransferase [Candidatus Dependentiae bacterium]|jgi:glycosyltransferase involved in cell wall biosynthesis
MQHHRTLRKIFHIVDDFPVGGIPMMLLTLLKNYQRLSPGTEHILVYIKDGPYRHVFEQAGFRTIGLRQYLPRYPLLLLPQLYLLMRREKPDLMHALQPHAWFHARLAGWLTSTPTVCAIHGDMSHKEHGRYQKLCMYLMGHLANHHICITEQSRATLLQMQNKRFSPARTSTVYNGIDVAAIRAKAIAQPLTRVQLGMPDDAFLIGCVSRLSPEKSVHVLIDAFAHLHRTYPKAHRKTYLCIVGEGGLRSSLEARVHTYGLTQFVIFAGAHTNPFPFYPLFDCLAHSSMTEGGAALVLLEAMVFGKPVITTHDRDTHEQITQGKEGFFVPINDRVALAERIHTVFAAPQMRTKMGAAGKQLVEQKYTAQKMAHDYLQTFCTVAREKTSS